MKLAFTVIQSKTTNDMNHPKARIYDLLESMAKKDRAISTNEIVSTLVKEGYPRNIIEATTYVLKSAGDIEIYGGSGTRGNPYLFGLSNTAVRYAAKKPYSPQVRKTKAEVAQERYVQKVAEEKRTKELREINSAPSKVLPGLNKSLVSEFARLSLCENKQPIVVKPEEVKSKSPLALVAANTVPGAVNAIGFVLTWRGIPLSFAEARVMYNELGELFGNK